MGLRRFSSVAMTIFRQKVGENLMDGLRWPVHFNITKCLIGIDQGALRSTLHGRRTVLAFCKTHTHTHKTAKTKTESHQNSSSNHLFTRPKGETGSSQPNPDAIFCKTNELVFIFKTNNMQGEKQKEGV